MSPQLRDLLDEAADDGGRPVSLDLAAVRAAGRRATWRQRALIAGGALGATAVITSIVLLAPGGDALFGPATGGSPGDTTVSPNEVGLAADPGEEALIDALEPLIRAIADRGYDFAIEGTIGSGMAAEEGGEPVDVQGTVVTVKQGDTVGAAVVAEFTDRKALGLVGDAVGFRWDNACAVHPVADEDFGWDSCEPVGESGEYHVVAEDDGSAVGVTLVRPDGSGISVALGTAIHDPSRQAPAPPLGGLPLTPDELVEIVDQLDARAPLAPPMLPPPTAEPEAPPPDRPCPGDAPPPECLPMDGAFVDADPLFEALGNLGLEVIEMRESVGESFDSSASSTVLQFALSDGAGRIGSAAIGVYADLDAARQFGADDPASGATATWCAVPPVERPEYDWSVAGDGPACTGLEHSGVAQMLGFYHLEDAGDAVGATLVRVDGSVISVSVGQAPAAEISSDATPLAAVPLNVAGLLDLLFQLDAANRDL